MDSDRTPQSENMNIIEAVECLEISPTSETTPSTDENSQAIAVPRQKVPPGDDDGGGDLSQSYHEIFDTQAYWEAAGPWAGQEEKTAGRAARGKLAGPEMAELAGPAEPTGHHKKGEVYYSGGKLVCEEDAGSTTNYLTSKLVADSLMWQQTFRNDSPSPEKEDGGEEKKMQLTKQASMADPALIEDLERQAKKLATDVDNVVENLSCILQSISALTVETVETYRDGVCKTCDAVDDNIKGMYQLMAKWEELNKSMAPAYRTSQQIKEIKRLLDVFESHLSIS